MSPKVIHIRNRKFTDNELYIGRPSKWGNPFIVDIDGTREEVIEKYKIWILKQKHLINSLYELTDKTLMCYCKPKLCHGDVLVELFEKLNITACSGYELPDLCC